MDHANENVVTSSKDLNFLDLFVRHMDLSWNGLGYRIYSLIVM